MLSSVIRSSSPMRRFTLLSVVAVLAMTASACVSNAQGGSTASASSSSHAQKILTNTSSVSSSSSSLPAPAAKPVSFHIPILVYHHIRPTAGYPKTTWSWKMSVTPSVFAKQMQWLEDHHYTTISLDTFVKIAKGEMRGPEKPVVITFDDNNENAFVSGFPVLKKHWFTATWYVITSRIDKSKDSLSSAQIKELSQAGMDIQSHSVTHPWLTSLSVSQQKWELDESRKTIEALTGKPVRHLAYPLTMQNAQVRSVVSQEGYVTGTIMDPRPATQKDDLLKLPRIMMTDDTGLAQALP